jgi:polysaccharide deacetylase
MLRVFLRRTCHIVAILLVACAAGEECGAGPLQWTWDYSPAAGEPAPTASVTPMKYGKTWAYTLEIDDGPKTTLTVAQPLLSQSMYTDAPPGVAGGSPHPFVGGAAVYCIRMEGNSAYLSWEDLQTLQQEGWGVLNHSYWHTGNHWDPSAALTPEQFRRELFWSQQMIALDALGGQRAATHFVYPNGDFNYGPYLAEFGLHSASHVGGSTRNLLAPGVDLTRMGRINLDEGAWTSRGGEVMDSFPTGGPGLGDLFIDFTHGISADTGSANYHRWEERLETIAAQHGAAGADDVWSAPSNEVIAYHQAAQAAAVQVQDGRVTLSLPDNLPGTPLTIRLDGVAVGSQMSAPAGGLLYRQGDTAWITTPTLGEVGSPIPEPKVRLVYQGAMRSRIEFGTTIQFAGIQIKQNSAPEEGFVPEVRIVRPDGGTTELDVDRILEWAPIGSAWGLWLLFPTLPDLEAVPAIALELATDPNLTEVKVYALDGPPMIPGDANRDGAVTDADYTIWADHYGQANAVWETGDFDGSRIVTDADYTIWADHYGSTAANVPEPLSLLIVLPIASRLRRRR